MELGFMTWTACAVAIIFFILWIYTMWSNNQAFKVMASEIESLNGGKGMSYESTEVMKEASKSKPKRKINPDKFDDIKNTEQ
jgi:hypothetical protein